MSDLGSWTRWASQLSAGLVAAAAVHAAADVRLVRRGAPQPNEPVGRPLRLGAHDLLRVRRGVGLEIRALDGHLWVTQDNDPRDVVLRPGETFRPDRNGRVLVAPLGTTAHVVVTASSRR